VPPGWTQESRTVRSALCMTREGFIGYFYGASIDPEVLALAMQRARCVHGLHLDMNAGHTGLEFYRTAPRGKLKIPARPLDDLWEARGGIPGMAGVEGACAGHQKPSSVHTMVSPSLVPVAARVPAGSSSAS